MGSAAYLQKMVCFILPEDGYKFKVVTCTSDRGSVNFGKKIGLIKGMADERVWLVKLHCANHRVELGVKEAIMDLKLNLSDAIQWDADEDVLTSYIASFKVVDGSTITPESFNAAHAHKLMKDCRVIQVEPLGMKFVQKESYEVAINEKKKVCENLKGVIDTKYSYFDQPIFQNMKWLDPQT